MYFIHQPTNYPIESEAYTCNSIQAGTGFNSLGLTNVLISNTVVTHKHHHEEDEISLFCTGDLIGWIGK